MPDPREQDVLKLVEQARLKSEAFIVVGFLPNHRFFYSCDPRIPIPDLHGVLQDHIDGVCDSVKDFRERLVNERSRS